MTTKKKTSSFMAMKGAGYYSRATIGAKHVMDNAAGLVLDAIDRMKPGESNGVFRISDMGAADGGTSLDLWRRVLAHIRQQAPDRPIEIVYTDLPRNDFSQVFQLVHGLTDNESYLNDHSNVYVMASGTSFHEAMFAPETLNLGFSATASHYVSHTPCHITDHVHMVGASGEQREAFKTQGANDWSSMLVRRAAEMVSGARLCLFNFGIDEQGRYLGNTGGVSMFDTFNRLWHDLADEGVISKDEYLSTNFPQHYREVAEFKAPFEDETSAVYKAGLRLEHADTGVVRCPFEQDFTENHHDPVRFAQEYLPTLRSWSEATFIGGLDASRSDQDKAAIVDTFYQRYQDLVAQDPKGHAMDYVHCYLVCTKV